MLRQPEGQADGRKERRLRTNNRVEATETSLPEVKLAVQREMSGREHGKSGKVGKKSRTQGKWGASNKGHRLYRLKTASRCRIFVQTTRGIVLEYRRSADEGGQAATRRGPGRTRKGQSKECWGRQTNRSPQDEGEDSCGRLHYSSFERVDGSTGAVYAPCQAEGAAAACRALARRHRPEPALPLPVCLLSDHRVPSRLVCGPADRGRGPRSRPAADDRIADGPGGPESRWDCHPGRDQQAAECLDQDDPPLAQAGAGGPAGGVQWQDAR